MPKKKEEKFGPYLLIPIRKGKYVSNRVFEIVEYYATEANEGKRKFPKLFEPELGIPETMGLLEIQHLLLHFLNWCGKRKIYLRQQ